MTNRKRTNIAIMLNLIKLLQNLWKIMAIAVSTGVLGFIFSFGISLLGAYAILSILPNTKEGLKNIFLGSFSTSTYFYGMAFCGFFRGILHYLEQYCNHFIAFHILAEIRVKLFKIMRKLAPAKMEGKNHGDIVSMITADIELLEVFYAHTISPIIIAFFTSVILFIYFLHLYPIYAFYVLFSQIFVGIIVPYFAMKRASKAGMETRNKLGKLNDEFLDKLKGVREIIQYSQGNKMAKRINDITLSLGENQKDLRNKMAEVQISTDSAIIFVSVLQLILSLFLISKNLVTVEAAILAGTLQVGSFAPYINLANLGNILSQTFASGERVLNLMEEKPSVDDNFICENIEKETLSSNTAIEVENLSFKYDNLENYILKNINLNIKSGQLIGIMGESGCGKSTLLKLLMRFWDASNGEIKFNSHSIKNLALKEVHNKFSYMTQSTNLFIGNLRDNLLVAKADASDEEIFAALKKAAFYDYVMSLPEKLDTIVEEAGKNFSGGEKQRIGLARSFLANREIFLLDEPTSNLDVLNEAIILKSLVEEAKNKTVILVSHRESTLSICDKVYRMKNGIIA
ncbi:MAG: ABC transporter ATP-binding protein [Fusobacterium sp.]|nr:ABC transporter ATP-binding protein [Fusobacterium sp.]